MQFSDIIGQEAVKSFLANTVKEKRISHAQLFLGKEGYGSLALALAYAQYIMCTDKQENDSCGKCKSCRKILKLEHPDLHFVFPTVGTKNSQPLISDDLIEQWRNFLKTNPYGTYEQWLNSIEAGNSQGGIKVREAENIIRKLNLKSFEAEYKIMIIWLPEKMNIESANKLLKLLEEPPQKTLFLLVSINSELIIKTILSRTQLVKIKRIDENDIFINLAQKQGIDEQKALEISRMSNGDFNEASNIIKMSADMQYNFDNFKTMMRFSYMGKFVEIIKWIDEISKVGREKQKSFFKYSLKMFRENFILNRHSDKISRMSKDETDFSKKFSQFIHPDNINELTEQFNLAYTHIARNANVKVVMLDVCIKINKLLTKEY